MKLSFCNRIIVLLTVLFALPGLHAQDAQDPQTLVYPGGEGEGKGKHIVFIAADEEYRSEESLPAMARMLSERHGFKCTVLFSINPANGTIDPAVADNIPGLEALKTADLMVAFMRFRHLPPDQMAKFVEYVESGRPVIGIRTATHAFSYDKFQSEQYSQWGWRGNHPEFKGGFGRQVLGETWVDHYGGYHSQSTRGIVVPAMKDHPVLRGIDQIWDRAQAYKVTELGGDSQPLLMGQPLKGLVADAEPDANRPPVAVAWVKTYTGAAGKPARVFTTTMGNGDDFKERSVRRLLANACFWCVGLEAAIKADANVDFCGWYLPPVSNFGDYRRGVKPADLQAKTQASVFQVQPFSREIAATYDLETDFYKKCLVVQDICIVTSDKVSDYALLEAAYQFDTVLKNIRPDIAQRVRDRKVICILVGHDEQVSELPCCGTDKKGRALDYYNWRSRGFLNLQHKHPEVLFTEEDVLEYEGGMQKESILIHEFGHVIAGTGFDEALRARLIASHKASQEKGLWNDGYAAQRFERVRSETPVSLYDALVQAFPDQSPELLKKCLAGGDILVNKQPCDVSATVTRKDKVLIVFGGPKKCYAASNQSEYWAEVVQCWYNTNRTMDHDHNQIHTRDQLKAYDPEAAALCNDVLGDWSWIFVSPRLRAGQDHLKGYSVEAAPKVKRLEHIENAGQDYYDEYWKTYWQRLYTKYNMEPPKG